MKTKQSPLPVRLLSTPADYERLGLLPGKVMPWEDGLRSNPAHKDYEWWYFDAELDDGSKLVITFFTKHYTQMAPGLAPRIDFNLTRPSGENIVKLGMAFAPEQFTASKEQCDVRIGRNSFAGDLKHYRIHVEFDDVICDVAFENALTSWRSATGIRHYGDASFNWLVAVPSGRASIALHRGGATENHTATCYHDHNWGDESLATLVHHWYWARGKAGPYFFVIADVIAANEYANAAAIDFLLAKDGEIVAGNGQCLTVTEKDVVPDPETHKPYANTLLCEYREGEKHYRIELNAHDIIVRTRFHDSNDGAYLRFTGEASVCRITPEGAPADEATETAIWEMMYFGKA